MVLTLLILPQTSKAANEDEAANKAAEALYIQTGINRVVENYAEDFQRKYIPLIFIENGQIIVLLIQTFRKDEVRISYKWTF